MKQGDTIRVTKQFSFDMAHALEGYDGPCKNIHGHTYRLAVTVSGKLINDPSHPKNGMVIDFTDFKSIVQKQVVKVFDHSLVLQRCSVFAQLLHQQIKENNILLTDYQPSCENLVIDCKNRIISHLPEEITLESVRLDETPTSYAEWFRTDNL
ncbi:MAG: 6-carboxytetrahydropterin synthase QueD [Candidatus Fluviicola riflensis]|nr:MAG: 6-carboxytetrahydropterin synthase QueD [Candidatus Fluviicola riflensis]OGS77159.1 MAG: 6-carboxytetrahydropterin synthase QueD [Candidatus Fluviicola riflensis]OGS82094.1 MAG: 6-carboxytetrahydropterin synthase QueD [Fluviicola sp. RIFCSPHIGHO2_01_FULL_43_53]OGS87788.1 MAG: 6-carboxytetrahydropterin synthase QueD [Fluviicola sp. RIFCSPHIGHO2_12_FULL_43_24]